LAAKDLTLALVNNQIFEPEKGVQKRDSPDPLEPFVISEVPFAVAKNIE